MRAVEPVNWLACVCRRSWNLTVSWKACSWRGLDATPVRGRNLNFGEGSRPLCQGTASSHFMPVKSPLRLPESKRRFFSASTVDRRSSSYNAAACAAVDFGTLSFEFDRWTFLAMCSTNCQNSLRIQINRSDHCKREQLALSEVRSWPPVTKMISKPIRSVLHS